MRDSLNYKCPYQAVCKCCWWCCKFKGGRGGADSKQHLSSRLTLNKKSKSRWAKGWGSKRGMCRQEIAIDWSLSVNDKTSGILPLRSPAVASSFPAVDSCQSLTVSVAALVHSRRSKFNDGHPLTFSLLRVLPAGLKHLQPHIVIKTSKCR